MAPLDAELGVRTGEVTLDGLECHVEFVSDFSVGPALGRQLHDAQFSGTQRFQACAPFPPWARASGFEIEG
jgi:hypothetical protein